MTDSIIGVLEVSLDVKLDVNVVWLKRDLRISDHQPLTDSIKSGLTLLYYVFEPLLIDDPHYDERHWRFVWQSIQDINNQLAPYNTRIYVYFGNAIDGLDEINRLFRISYLFSHEETGLLSTFDRDKSVDKWCKEREIIWCTRCSDPSSRKTCSSTRAL